MEFGPLGPEHADQLEHFQCHRSMQSWTAEVEFAIQERVAEALEHGSVQAFGLWDGPNLRGLAVWSLDREDPSIWECGIIAVENALHGEQHGRSVKEELVRRARGAGASAIVSFVHRENTPMLAINRGLGAKLAPDPSDLRYFICTIVL